MSSAATLEMSQMWARETSMTTFSGAAFAEIEGLHEVLGGSEEQLALDRVGAGAGRQG
jgi:hypothetical protein